MPIEGIRKVREAEEEAEDKIDAASERAERIIADGSDAASRVLAAAEGRASARAREIQEQARLETDVEIRAIEQAAEKERERVTRLAEMHRDAAVKVVLEAMER
ncbi:MAG: hypothetical protein V1748_04405 [Actinomycetota bacterium]